MGVGLRVIYGIVGTNSKLNVSLHVLGNPIYPREFCDATVKFWNVGQRVWEVNGYNLYIKKLHYKFKVFDRKKYYVYYILFYPKYIVSRKNADSTQLQSDSSPTDSKLTVLISLVLSITLR